MNALADAKIAVQLLPFTPHLASAKIAVFNPFCEARRAGLAALLEASAKVMSSQKLKLQCNPTWPATRLGGGQQKENPDSQPRPHTSSTSRWLGALRVGL